MSRAKQLAARRKYLRLTLPASVPPFEASAAGATGGGPAAQRDPRLGAE